jgi:hypothetical protein
MFAACFCQFLVPDPRLCPEFLFRILTAAHYARDFLLLNLTIMSSAVSSPFLIFSTTVRNAKPSLGSESTKKLSENAQASLRTIRWIMAILIQASLVRGLIS